MKIIETAKYKQRIKISLDSSDTDYRVKVKNLLSTKWERDFENRIVRMISQYFDQYGGIDLFEDRDIQSYLNVFAIKNRLTDDDNIYISDEFYNQLISLIDFLR